jgi:hydrogenase small subunit
VEITRRDFLKLAGASAAAVGLSMSDLSRLEQALANPAAPTVLWLQGAACTGCSVSFLNRVSSSAPKTAADVLIGTVNLRYHPNLMAAAGESAVNVVRSAYDTGGYILVVEGGVPTAFSGAACWAWTYNGVDVTFKDAVTSLAARAGKILCVGTCASWGGIPAAPPNPTGIVGVKTATGKSTINIAGCPAHPDDVVWVISQLLLGRTISLDGSGRPKSLFPEDIHEHCPYEDSEEAERLGLEGRCLEELGCRGKETQGRCQVRLFNGGVNWCMGAGAPCIGCNSPSFPGTQALYKTTGESDD